MHYATSSKTGAWNGIPQELRLVTSIERFRSKVKDW